MFRNKFYVQRNAQDVPAHLNVGKYILENLSTKEDVAMENVETGEKTTYRELKQHAVKMAVALYDLGVRQGDVVAVGSEYHSKCASSTLGVLLCGATVTIFGIDVGKACLEGKIEISKPSYFLCTELFWEKYEDILKNNKHSFINIRLEKDLSLADEIDVDMFEPLPVLGQSDTALISFSSGTTGMPKGVPLTHLNCVLLCKVGIPSSVKTAYLRSSIEFIGSFSILFFLLTKGVKVIYTTDASPETIVMAFEKGQVELAVLYPAYINMLLKSESTKKVSLPFFHSIFTLGSEFLEKTAERLKDRFPSLKVISQAYGMTETGCLTNISFPKSSKKGSVGYPHFGITMKIVDLETQAVLGPHQQGEIRVKGYSIMKGYIDVDPSTYLDKEGWFRTGDIGYFDDDGYLYFVGRNKDVIMCCSIIVSPSELESILMSHPGVFEAGVVGKPDPIYEQVPAAFVVRQPGSSVTEQELIDFVADQVEPRMQLRGGVRFIPEIPKNERGKTLRRSLLEMLQE